MSTALTKHSTESMSGSETHEEGRVARTIEHQTAKLPSDVFLWGAMGFAGLSLGLHIAGDEDNSRFFGQWVSPLLIMGVYNKIVKVAGSDHVHGGRQFQTQY